MSSVEESRTAKALARDIQEAASKAPGPLRFMEVCGTHTMAIHAAGLKVFSGQSQTCIRAGMPRVRDGNAPYRSRNPDRAKLQCRAGDFRRSDKGSRLFRVACDIPFPRWHGPSGLFASGFS